MVTTQVGTVDRYPTRTPHDMEVIRRPEPLIPCGRPDGPFDLPALAAYTRTGFTTVPGLLSAAEIEVYQQESVRLAADEQLRDDERVILEKDSSRVRSIFEVHRISPLIAELIGEPRILGRACQLLGSEVYVHQSRVNYLPAFTGKGFYWHSDFETWHAEDGMPAPRAVSMSLALTDNHPFNGALMVMPGSQHTFVPCPGETPADHYQASLREQEIGVPSRRRLTELATAHGIEQFTGPAGSALWFDANLMHGSGNNITPYPRSNIFVVFNSVENTLTAPFAAPAPRPEFVAARDFTPLR
jgi:ectoine hydroxylase